MGLPVVVKSGKKYLTLVLDPDLDFPELLKEIITKFMESQKFYGKEPIAIAFEGRNLSNREQLQIMDAIDCYTSVRVMAIVEQDRLHEYAASEALRKYLDPQGQNFTQISKESICTYINQNVASGECVSSRNTIVIMGNVAEGAMVSSGENVIILGSLFGSAVAGTEGDAQSRIIVSGVFMPENFRIGNILGPIPKKNKFALNKRSKKNSGKVAYLADGAVQIDDFTQFI